MVFKSVVVLELFPKCKQTSLDIWKENVFPEIWVIHPDMVKDQVW